MSLDGPESYEDTSASTLDSANSLNSTARTARKTGTKSICAPKFCSWSFQLTIKVDFAGAADKGQHLKEHISERTTIDRPFCVTPQIAFFDTSLLSAVPDSDGLVSIALHGFVPPPGAEEHQKGPQDCLPTAVRRPTSPRAGQQRGAPRDPPLRANDPSPAVPRTAGPRQGYRSKSNEFLLECKVLLIEDS